MMKLEHDGCGGSNNARNGNQTKSFDSRLSEDEKIHGTHSAASRPARVLAMRRRSAERASSVPGSNAQPHP